MKVKLTPIYKKYEEITITTDYIKLDSFLKFANVIDTGGMAKNVILDGMVKVNGFPCTQRGKKLKDGDYVSFNGLHYKIKHEDK